jgi:hypothetical protein
VGYFLVVGRAGRHNTTMSATTTHLPPPVLRLILSYLLDGRTEGEKVRECESDTDWLRGSAPYLPGDRLWRFLHPIHINLGNSKSPWRRCSWLLQRLCHINRRTMSHAFVGVCECNLRVLEKEESSRLRPDVLDALRKKRVCHRVRCTNCFIHRPDAWEGWPHTPDRWPVNLPPVEIIFCDWHFLERTQGQQGWLDGLQFDVALRMQRKRKLQWLVIVSRVNYL